MGEWRRCLRPLCGERYELVEGSLERVTDVPEVEENLLSKRAVSGTSFFVADLRKHRALRSVVWDALSNANADLAG